MKRINDWLEKIELFNPNEIELGLDRVRLLVEKLAIDLSNSKVVIVGGTNGKGSCVATLESLAIQSDVSVGCYTSPHLLSFNERIRVEGNNISDQSLCEAFQLIEDSRKEIPLTFFEYTTLAALLIFQKAQLDLIVLEVGLGGRLDAVNVVEPDVSVLTTIDKDHQSWLGDGVEQIAVEKSGIFRHNGMNLVGDHSSFKLIENIGIDLEVVLLNNVTFFKGIESCLSAKLAKREINPQRLLAQNIGLAFSAFNHLYPGMIDTNQIESVVKNIHIAGRFQTISWSPKVIIDVAHNPQSANNLVRQIQEIPNKGRRFAICGMMADKATTEYIGILDSTIDGWVFVDLPVERAATGETLLGQFERTETSVFAVAKANVESAMDYLSSLMMEQDIIFVIGSFYTVAELLKVREK